MQSGFTQYDSQLRRILGASFFISSSPMLCYRVNDDNTRGRIVAVNNAFVDFYGYTFQQASRMTVHDLDAPELRTDVVPFKQRFNTEEIRCFETVHVKADGSLIPIEVRAFFVGEEGERYVISSMSITSSRKIAEIQDTNAFREKVLLKTRELEDLSESLSDANAELRRREMQFETAQELGGIGSWSVNLRTGDQVWSDQVYRITGLMEEEVDFDSGILLDMVAEEDRSAVVDAVDGCILEGRDMDMRFSINAKDGARKDVHVRGVVERDEYKNTVWLHGFIRDLSVDKIRSSRARLGEEIFRSIFLSSTSVMLLVDTESGEIIRANDAACRFYGYAHEELEGMHISVINTLDPEAIRNKMNDVAACRHANFNFRHRLACGEVRDVSVHSGPVSMFGRNMLYSIVIDVTEQRKTELALRRAKQEAERASRAKSEFLANMSHEIRTPLNGVLGMLQLLRQTVTHGEELEYVETALNSGHNLLRLISDILDLSRVEAGRMDIDVSRFNPEGLVRGALDLFRRTALEKGILLRLDLPKGFPVLAVGDEVRIRQILFNLIGNAVKFTHEGSVFVWSKIIYDSKGPLILAGVEDTGIGIDPDLLDNIFNPFTQADSSHTRNYQGSGLGLSIARRLVGLLGGTLTIESELGEGTTIIFSIRIEIPEVQQQLEDDAEKTAQPLQGGLKILLVEDERVNRLTARRMLEKGGHEVLCAENGREALSVLSGNAVDCVLMDVQMPVMDGVEALKHIRDGKTTAPPMLPVIALTAHAMAGDRERLMAAGMDGYLTKPIAAMELLRTVDELGRPRQQTA